jgi:hypothetical protein
LAGQHVVGRGGRRHHLHRAEPGEVSQDGVLDAEVERHDAPRPEPTVYGSGVVTWLTRSTPSVPGSALRGGPEVVGPGGPERSGHRSDVADEAGEAAGVDAGDAGDAVVAQQRVQFALAALVRARRASSRTITPRQKGRRASKSARFTP